MALVKPIKYLGKDFGARWGKLLEEASAGVDTVRSHMTEQELQARVDQLTQEKATLETKLQEMTAKYKTYLEMWALLTIQQLQQEHGFSLNPEAQARVTIKSRE